MRRLWPLAAALMALAALALRRGDVQEPPAPSPPQSQASASQAPQVEPSPAPPAPAPAVPAVPSASEAAEDPRAGTSPPAHEAPTGGEDAAVADDDDDDSAGALRFAVDKEGIQSAVQEVVPEIGYCYEEWLQIQPDLGGRVVVAFQIGAGGRVVDIDLDDDTTTEHTLFEGCVLNVVQGLRFDEPDGVIWVRYPLMFSPD